MSRQFLRIYLPYFLLTLFVIAPLLMPGYILTLDMVFAPHPPLPDEITSSYIFRALLHLMSFIIPSDIIQKIILSLIIFVSALGAYRLVESIRPAMAVNSNIWQLGLYIAGILYAINPFTYARFMGGQYSVLLGYALLPWFVLTLLRFLQKPSLRPALILTSILLVISIVSIHTFGIAILFTIIAASVLSWQHRQSVQLKNLCKYSLVIAGAFLLLSSYWLIPALLGRGPIADAVTNVDQSQVDAFAATGGLLSILQLHGFWAEATGMFISADEPLPFSGIWQLLLWALIGTGIIAAFRRQLFIALIFCISGVVSILLALGVFQNILTTLLPVFAGYREPHKFVMLLCLSYAYFGAWGFYFIADKFRRRRVLLTAFFCCASLLPLLVTPAMLWGFNSQLRPAQYPDDWYSINTKLSNEQTNKILVLPWHLYMRYSFAGGRIVANPADQFFSDHNVIISDDPEFNGVRPLAHDPLKQKLSTLIAHKNHPLTGPELRALGISHILLVWQSDADTYRYLANSPGIQLIEDTKTLKLYEVEK